MLLYARQSVRFEWQSLHAPIASSACGDVAADLSRHGRVCVVAPVRNDLGDEEERDYRDETPHDPLPHHPIMMEGSVGRIRVRPAAGRRPSSE